MNNNRFLAFVTATLQHIFSGIQFIIIHKTTSADRTAAHVSAFADSHAVDKLHDKYFAVTNITGMSSFDNCTQSSVNKRLIYGNIEADFIEQPARFFGAPVNFRDGPFGRPVPERS